MIKHPEALKGLFLSLLLVVPVCLIGRVKAGPPQPDREDRQNLEDVKRNQRTKEQLKEWNRLEVEALNKKGFQIKWDQNPDNLMLVPLHSPITWDGAPGWKNDILATYQQKLAERGVTDPELLKLLVSQIIQESGVNPEALGDNGCSWGLIQYNACARHGVKAKRFVERNPEWATVDKQLTWMADAVSWRVGHYPNHKLAIVAHNLPRAANNGQVTHYYYDVEKHLSSLSL